MLRIALIRSYGFIIPDANPDISTDGGNCFAGITE